MFDNNIQFAPWDVVGRYYQRRVYFKDCFSILGLFLEVASCSVRTTCSADSPTNLSNYQYPKNQVSVYPTIQKPFLTFTFYLFSVSEAVPRLTNASSMKNATTKLSEQPHPLSFVKVYCSMHWMVILMQSFPASTLPSGFDGLLVFEFSPNCTFCS